MSHRPIKILGSEIELEQITGDKEIHVNLLNDIY
jgi:hypothetical protein